MTASPYAAELRQRVEAQVRGTDHSLARIGREAGVPVSAVVYWNRAHGWRPIRAARRVPLSTRRRDAVERLYRNPAIGAADLAAVLGMPGREAARYFRECGFGDRRKAVIGEPSVKPIRSRTLQRSLRRHIARQIARFDAALDADDADAARLDSAKVLRDLGGLKRLLDEIDAGMRAGEGGDGEGTDEGGSSGRQARSGSSALDLPALRARIAQSYAALAGERADAELPGEPAA